MQKEAKSSRLGQYDAKSEHSDLNISEPFRFASFLRPVFDGRYDTFLTLYRPRPFFQGFRQNARQKHVFARSIATRQSELLPDRLLLHCIHRNDVLPGKGSIRQQITTIAAAELGIKEATGKNDGKRVEQYLRYTNLGKGHQWCAAFVSWCYGQAGLTQPRNPWSPALFPNARTYWKRGKFANLKIREFAIADVFGIYSSSAKRINHVGLIKERDNKYLITIEGNSNNRVESRRRHLSTIYALADWITENQNLH
ncbi:C40 family peptidase [Sphingobacterium alkalisoli]|uniref:hypothetical protein n=1 Tax=Sphingobacterium alkalisoli TaxID=1874115 RepID=UPI001E5D81FD|nr:hypothetical protein [Sphingobacterium alkalisoli]